MWELLDVGTEMSRAAIAGPFDFERHCQVAQGSALVFLVAVQKMPELSEYGGVRHTKTVLSSTPLSN